MSQFMPGVARNEMPGADMSKTADHPINDQANTGEDMKDIGRYGYMCGYLSKNALFWTEGLLGNPVRNVWQWATGEAGGGQKHIAVPSPEHGLSYISPRDEQGPWREAVYAGDRPEVDFGAGARYRQYPTTEEYDRAVREHAARRRSKQAPAATDAPKPGMPVEADKPVGTPGRAQA